MSVYAVMYVEGDGREVTGETVGPMFTTEAAAEMASKKSDDTTFVRKMYVYGNVEDLESC